jgi:hypothetical protein
MRDTIKHTKNLTDTFQHLLKSSQSEDNKCMQRPGRMAPSDM